METLFLALRVLVALGAILALIWFVQRKVTGKQSGGKKAVAGRFGAARLGMSRKAIQVIGTHRLGAKASISVVEIDGVTMVLGVTEHGISVLENAPQPLVVAPAAASIAHPEAIAPESDLTRVAASAVDTLATADVRVEPEPVDFAAVLREALGEAADTPALTTVTEPAASDDQLSTRRRRRSIPALAEQLLPHMTRTLAAGIGIRMEPTPAPQAAATPASAPTATTGGALAAFLANAAPAEDVEAAPAKDYSTAQPLSAHLRVLQRAS
jgi:flagellar protein FliO/FliZ